MLRRRSADPRALVTLVLLSFLATNGLPRAAWYAHRHAGDLHGHVHGWDGARVGSSVSVRDFLGDDQAHDHVHGADDGRRTSTGSTRTRTARRAPRAATRAAVQPRAPTRATGPQLTAADDGAHGHWQAPFQSATRAAAARIVPSLVASVLAPRAPAGSPRARALAVRARAPPVAPV